MIFCTGYNATMRDLLHPLRRREFEKWIMWKLRCLRVRFWAC